MRTSHYAKNHIIAGNIKENNIYIYRLDNLVKNSLMLIFLVSVASNLNNGNLANAQAIQLSNEQSCNEFLVAKKRINGEMVGHEDCLMREVAVVDNTWPEVTEVLGLGPNKRYRRIEIGLTGTLMGYAVKAGPRIVTFTSAPEFVFPQSGSQSQPEPGILRYDMLMGASMSLIFPEDGSWNGKLFLTLPGMGSFRTGTSKKWDENYDPELPMGDVDKYQKLMLAKGYAVALTRRNHLNRQPGDGDYTVRLLDGTVLMDRNPVDTPELIIGYAQVAQRVLANRMGREPSRTYWYGHSGGGRLGRLVNYNHYRTSANTGEDGMPVIDGLLVDDSGAGLFLPQVFRNNEDILYQSEEDRKAFVPMLEVGHQLYINDRNDPVPDWVSTNFLMNKYRNAQLLRDKGLTDKFRFYEVRGISHDGGEDLPNQKRGNISILPMWRLMEGFVDMLDAWVDHGITPPPTRADWAELGDSNRDGVNENTAIQLPEVACPLGVYYPFPPPQGNVGYTAFAAFDGTGEEPFDGRAIKKAENNYPHIAVATFADMNLNGFRDFRETVSQAWHRLGLLRPNQKINKERYVRCIENSVNQLTSQRFISEKVGKYYIDQARSTDLPDWVK
jgi:hypothetical protein